MQMHMIWAGNHHAVRRIKSCECGHFFEPFLADCWQVPFAFVSLGHPLSASWDNATS